MTRNSRTSKLFFALFLLFAAFGVESFGQTQRAPKPAPADDSHVRSSPAFAELVLRKTELESELEALIIDYTEEFPKVIELRYETGLVNKEVERLLTLKLADSGKLTLALGKLLVKKAELETDLWELLKTYKEQHPEVKRAKRKVEIYENAVKDILGK